MGCGKVHLPILFSEHLSRGLDLSANNLPQIVIMYITLLEEGIA